MANFETVTQQRKLKQRRAPYWHRLAVGQHIGVRKTSGGLHWQARAYDPATQKEAQKALGDFGHLAAHERYSAACSAAREWFAHLSKGGTQKQITVAEAWELYAAHQRKEKGEKAAYEVERRFRQFVKGDPIEFIPMAKLTRHHVDAWRERLEAKPARTARRGKNCRVKTPLPPPQPRAQSTINRDLVAMKAALNLAFEKGYVTSNHAWRSSLKPYKGVNQRRTLYLDRDQRKALVQAIEDPHLGAFVEALAVLPLRPGALAALTVGDFDAKQGTLTVRKDKAGAGRTIPVPDLAADLLRKASKGKLPTAPLLARWDGKPWPRDQWNDGIKNAAEAAGLPSETVAYSLRHAAITDLVTAGLDLFTVAALSGTSATMIEKHYGHLQHDRARDALAGLAL